MSEKNCHEIGAESSRVFSLSGPVSILQSRFNKAQVSDIQETKRVVRLAEAHTDLARPVCKIPLDEIFLVS